MLTELAAPDLAAPTRPTEVTLALPQLVAVYGTLKRDKSNHHRITESDLKYYGDDITEESSYLLVGGHGFPYLHKGGDERVGVELYEFTGEPDVSLRSLDQLEGHPRWYRREEVTMTSGAVAWIYLQPAFEDGRSSADVTRARVTTTDGTATWN